jgi:hypothetical protein
MSLSKGLMHEIRVPKQNVRTKYVLKRILCKVTPDEGNYLRNGALRFDLQTPELLPCRAGSLDNI